MMYKLDISPLIMQHYLKFYLYYSHRITTFSSFTSFFYQKYVIMFLIV